MNLNVKMAVHNKFEIQVLDARTGKVKQEAEAYNVVTNDFFKVRLKVSYSQYGFNFNGIYVGDGSGTPAITDTALFHGLDWYSTETIETVYQYPTSHITKRITIGVTELNGKTLTEVGLYMYRINSPSYGTALCSHAMIKDSEGQQIAIQKTDTDVVYITATFYCTYTASGFGDNGIYPAASDNMLVRWMLGTVSSASSGLLSLRAHSGVLSQSSDLLNNYIRYKSIDFPYGTGDLSTLRFVQNEITITDTEFNTGLIRTLGIPGVGAFAFPDPTVFPDYDISHLSLGDGDGQQTEFSLQCPVIKAGTLKVYVDSIEQTEGVDYTADLENNCIDTRSEYYTAGMKLGENAVFGDAAERSPYTSSVIHDPLYWGSYPISGYIYPSECQITNAKPVWIDFGAAKACNRLRIDSSSSISETIRNNLVIEFSNDNETWTAVTKEYSKDPDRYFYLWTFPLTTARYWRVYSNGQTWRYYLYSSRLYGRENNAESCSTFALGKSVPGLVFDTPPAVGKAIDVSYKIDIPYKTANNLMRFTCTIQMQRG